uniref:Uncharacterized protein n=1 Tax=Anguilla anguilla TaxID=7936 RepID=A0A0E9SXY4_ANGAN
MYPLPLGVYTFTRRMCSHGTSVYNLCRATYVLL